MKQFMDETFLLDNETARELYFDTAQKQPIVDFHNHLSPKEMAENKGFTNLTEAWLACDHYKWRAMRANGISEAKITGDASDKEKFDAWADSVNAAFGNPLHHWTHLELQRYFNIRTPLSLETADEIWEEANSLLGQPGYGALDLLDMQNVEILCTTDDPADNLAFHKQLQAAGRRAYPTFRPEKAMAIQKPEFLAYIEQLEQAAEMPIRTMDDMLTALEKRLDYFVTLGCRVSDHSIESGFFPSVPQMKEEALPTSATSERAAVGSDDRMALMEEAARRALEKALANTTVSDVEAAAYRGYLLSRMGALYAAREMVMQLHIGPLRNVSSRLYRLCGADAGGDCAADFLYAEQLTALLDSMDRDDRLPRTILYNLKPGDERLLSLIASSFGQNEKGIRGKVQLGTAWWHNDHKNGMRMQMEALADTGLFSTFIGMLTDSRSFLSFPRHEYFRRILCNFVGTLVENGEYPRDMKYLHKMIADICHDNAKQFFGFL